MSKILIVDFGGQYCHLIARRLGQFNIQAEIVPHTTPASDIKSDKNIKGLIFSGGARSVYEKDAPSLKKDILNIGLPILGICYGHQLISYLLGGEVQSGQAGEYGQTNLLLSHTSPLFEKLSKQQKVWMNHRDVVTALPNGFQKIAETEHSHIAAYQNKSKNIFGVQFHPEVIHTPNGIKILKNFALNICRCKKESLKHNFVDSIVVEAKTTIGENKAIIGLSGGIDSSVSAILVGRAIGNNLTAVYVDTGLMRYGETESIKNIFKSIPINLKIIQAQSTFFKALKGVSSPEKKRKIIGKLFIDIFEKAAKESGAKYLVQGTIYPDRIESGLTNNSSNIKSHHNVGGLPKRLRLKLYEPLRDLYKDEVRTIAKHINLPLEIRTRQVFPGPGLAVRIVGEVTPEKAEIVRKAGYIIEQELRQTTYWKKIWMSFAVLLPIKSVGVQGDERSYKFPIVIRIIESEDAMTANFSKISFDLLEKISTRITNEIREINRVVYDVTNKPPATMEWE